MRPLLAGIIVVLLADVARARTNVGYTAEWLTQESDLVVTAMPLEVRTAKGPGQVWFTQVRFKLDQVVKGPAASGDTLTIYDFSYDEADPLDMEGAIKRGRSVAVFAVVAKNKFPEVDGKYVPFAVTRKERSRSIFLLDEPVEGVYSPEFQRLTKIDELMKRAGEQVSRAKDFLRQYPGGRVERDTKEAPMNSPASTDLYGGSAVYLLVPAYREKA
jgi:hypothetical protein